MQTNRQVAEMIAHFHTPPGCDWHQLADDIEMALEDRCPQETRELQSRIDAFHADTKVMNGG